jgi:hypothetical protein
VLWPFKWLLILFWRIAWRGTVVVVLLVGVGVFFITRPVCPPLMVLTGAHADRCDVAGCVVRQRGAAIRSLAE